MGTFWFEVWDFLLSFSHSCHCISLHSNEMLTQKLHMCNSLLWFPWGQLSRSNILCGRLTF